jgi:hypothetical protein
MPVCPASTAGREGVTNMIAGQLAIIVAAVFAGAAIYVNVAEQPARLNLDDRSLLIQWKAAYKRGTAMQAPLAMLGFLLGLWSWWQTNDWRWLLGAVILVANCPIRSFASCRPTAGLWQPNPRRPEPRAAG